MKMRKSRLIKFMAIFCVGMFLVSLLTVELHKSGSIPWLKYPGFLEADSEIALVPEVVITIEGRQAVVYRPFPRQDVFLDQTTLFLHVYRGPPSLVS